MKPSILKIVMILAISAALLTVAAGAWYGYGAWSRHEARSTLDAAGVTYSEASFIEHACRGDEVAVLLFLQSGMSAKVQGADGTTALHCLLRSRKNNLAALLVSKGADVNAKTNVGQTPLMEAAKSGSSEEMQALISAGASVNASDNFGNTPLLLAAGAVCSATSCKEEAIDLLLSHGADPKVVNLNGETVLSKLIQTGNAKDFSRISALASKFIKSGADINASVAYGQPLLCYAAQQGNMDLVTNLVSLGANVNIAGKRCTPLIAATKWPAELKLLLDSKADPNLADESGNTPLVAAVDQRSVESVKLLLDAGAKVDPPPLAPTGALQEAAKFGDLQLMTLLLNHAADVNGKNSQGDTPLLVLARNSYGDPPVRAEIAKMLMQRGANPKLPDKNGSTAVEVALSINSLNLASTLAGKKLTKKYLLMHPEVKPVNRGVPLMVVPRSMPSGGGGAWHGG